jgi:hypothetical protein
LSRKTEELERLAAARRADLQDLCAEFQSAISALTANDLEALKTSIEKQEHLAAKLQSLFQPENLADCTPAIPKEALDLIAVTRVYSALLQRSMKTASLRAALCQTYKQHFTKAGAPIPDNSWSCEV